MELGRVGVWTFQLGTQPKGRAQELAAELEGLGYGAIWIPETIFPDPLVLAALLLEPTDRIVVATGIANIWLRTPVAMAGGQRILAESFPDRFLLGLGASHGPLVEGVLSEPYRKPLTKMRSYLDGLDAALGMATATTVELPRVLAALGPKMLALAAERAAGAHPYFVPVEHTALAREAIGKERLLAVEQAVVLERDPAAARQIARKHMAIYLGLPNYTNNLRRLGFGDDDFADGGSDRLADAIVAWGDVDTVASRVRQHHDAGADHVCIQVLGSSMREAPVDQWRALASALV